MSVRVLQFCAIVLTALALVPAGAHFFELRTVPDPERDLSLFVELPGVLVAVVLGRDLRQARDGAFRPEASDVVLGDPQDAGQREARRRADASTSRWSRR